MAGDAPALQLLPPRSTTTATVPTCRSSARRSLALPGKCLQIGRCSLPCAFLYGQDLLDQSKRTQTRDGQEIRRRARGVESEERLCRSGATPARCQSDASSESLRSHRPPPRFHSPLQSFASDFSRARLPGIDPWRDEIKLVELSCSHVAVRRTIETGRRPVATRR